MSTFMVIDLIESDAVLAQLGEGRAASSRAAYITFLHQAVAAHHGHEVMRQHGQALLAFDTPTAAVACAVSIQQAAQRHNHAHPDRLDARVGIQLGETPDPLIVSDDGELIAQPAIEARRLCEAAPGGHILVSDVVSALARPTGSSTFEQAGLLDLSGSGDPTTTFEVLFADATASRPPLPPELVARPRGRCTFVGRPAERERLRGLWASATAGARRLAFMTGEPGIGKSRLAAEFAREAHEEGAIVLSGRSFEESIVPYQPFVEALRQYTLECDPDELDAQLRGDPAPLATLVPELAERLPGLSPSEVEVTERHRLFDSVAALLSTISRSSPLLLVLDDLQWADPATLLLLKHIVLDPRPASLLILGLYRDTEVSPSHPLVQLRTDIGRDFAIDQLRLGGLEDEDVASMLDEMIGWSPPRSVARGLCADTEGNPFFLEEVIAQLDESGVAADRDRMNRGHLVAGELGVPARVRDYVARRIQRLSPRALEVLSLAAVVGTEFDLDVLASVLSSDVDDLIEVLDEAVGDRLVIESASRPGTYVFAHTLFQSALYEEQSTNRRALRHARVAAAVEALHPDDVATLSDLARHYALAAGRYAEKVVHYGGAAGDHAFGRLAYEDAIAEYSRALDAIPLVPSAGELTKADLLVRLGEAQTRVVDAAAAKRSFLAAAEQCRSEDAGDILARAALGYGGTGKFGSVFDPFQAVDETLVSLLERAIDACAGTHELTCIRLMGWLAQALYWSADDERKRALSQEALEAARLTGDPTAVAHALHSRHVALWGPDHAPELRAAAEEMLALGLSLPDRDIQLKAFTWLITDALETDPIDVVEDYIESYTGLVKELHRPYLLGYANSMRAAIAHFQGHLDRMERALATQLADAERADAFRANEAHQWQNALLMLDLGRVDDDLIGSIAEQQARYPGPTFGVMSVLALSLAGRGEVARREFGRVIPADPASIPRDCMWAGTLAMLTRVVCELEMRAYARPLYELLQPYAERCLLWGSGFIVFGPADRFLGLLAMAFGEPDLAVTHLERALRRADILGSPPLATRLRPELARALQARGVEGDDERARVLLADAADDAPHRGDHDRRGQG